MQRWTVDLNLLGVGTVAGAGVGFLIGGLSARLMMRIVATHIAMPASFTTGGTILILLLSLMLGTALGGIYGLFHRLVPITAVWKGLLFGAVVCVLFVVIPFVSVTEGELVLISPFLGIVLFGWIPLLYALILAVTVDRYTRTHEIANKRRVRVTWFAGFVCMMIFALASMSSLMSNSVRTPGFVRRLLEGAGVSFHQVGDVEGFIGAAIVLAWLVLATMIFWQGSDSAGAKLSAILLLAFAGAFFHKEDSIDQWFAGLWGSRWLVALIRTLGLGALLLLFPLVLEGVPARNWPRPVLVFWTVWLVFWLLVPAGGLSAALPAALELGMLAAIAILLASGLSVQFYYCAQAPHGMQRRQRLCVAGGFALAAMGFLLVWGMTLLMPDMRLSHVSGVATSFAVAPYLIPWLALPAMLLLAMQRYHLWQSPQS